VKREDTAARQAARSIWSIRAIASTAAADAVDQKSGDPIIYQFRASIPGYRQ